MNSRLKTLIIFDTNSLRKVRINEKEREIIDYSGFDFGSPFKKIKLFIEEHKIDNIIRLGIPEMVLLELQNQCEKQFQKEFRVIQEALIRISEIPSKNGITLADPDQDFDYQKYIKEKVETILSENQVIKIPFDEDKTLLMFKNMLEKVLDVENVKSPFRPKDAGFKDNIIWESLIRFEGMKDYNKIFFVTKDGDYKSNCYEEFNELWPEQEIFIRKDSTQVILDLERIYGDYLKEKEIYDFANSEYFRGFVNEELESKSMIVINENEYKITKINVLDYCDSIDNLPPDETGEENVLIFSKIKVTYTEKIKNKNKTIEMMTMLSDKISKEIVSLDYDIDIR